MKLKQIYKNFEYKFRKFRTFFIKDSIYRHYKAKVSKIIYIYIYISKIYPLSFTISQRF